MVDRRLRNSPYGYVIHEDVYSEDMPKDADLMIRSIKAYWDHAVEEAYPYHEDLSRSRMKSAYICSHLMSMGWGDKYPEAAYRAAQYQDRVRGDRTKAQEYAEYWCEYILLKGDILALNRAFIYYLEQLDGSWDKVLDLCRKRVEYDFAHREAPIGLMLLRYYLRLYHFVCEREQGESMDHTALCAGRRVDMGYTRKKGSVV